MQARPGRPASDAVRVPRVAVSPPASFPPRLAATQLLLACDWCHLLHGGLSPPSVLACPAYKQKPRAPGLGRSHWRPGTTAPSRSTAEKRDMFSEAGTASVTALAPPDQGKSGCSFAAVYQGKKTTTICSGWPPLRPREVVSRGMHCVPRRPFAISGPRGVTGSLVGDHGTKVPIDHERRVR